MIIKKCIMTILLSLVSGDRGGYRAQAYHSMSTAYVAPSDDGSVITIPIVLMPQKQDAQNQKHSVLHSASSQEQKHHHSHRQHSFPHPEAPLFGKPVSGYPPLSPLPPPAFPGGQYNSYRPQSDFGSPRPPHAQEQMVPLLIMNNPQAGGLASVPSYQHQQHVLPQPPAQQASHGLLKANSAQTYNQPLPPYPPPSFVNSLYKPNGPPQTSQQNTNYNSYGAAPPSHSSGYASYQQQPQSQPQTYAKALAIGSTATAPIRSQSYSPQSLTPPPPPIQGSGYRSPALQPSYIRQQDYPAPEQSNFNRQVQPPSGYGTSSFVSQQAPSSNYGSSSSSAQRYNSPIPPSAPIYSASPNYASQSVSAASNYGSSTLRAPPSYGSSSSSSGYTSPGFNQPSYASGSSPAVQTSFAPSHSSQNSYSSSHQSSQNSYPASPQSSQNGYPASPQSSQNGYPASPQSSQNGYPASPQSSQNGYPASPQSSQNGYPASPQSSQNGYPASSQSSQNGYPASSQSSQNGYPASSQSSQNGYPASSQSSQNGYPASPQSSPNGYSASSQSSLTNFSPVSAPAPSPYSSPAQNTLHSPPGYPSSSSASSSSYRPQSQSSPNYSPQSPSGFGLTQVSVSSSSSSGFITPGSTYGKDSSNYNIASIGGQSPGYSPQSSPAYGKDENNAEEYSSEEEEDVSYKVVYIPLEVLKSILSNNVDYK